MLTSCPWEKEGNEIIINQRNKKDPFGNVLGTSPRIIIVHGKSVCGLYKEPTRVHMGQTTTNLTGKYQNKLYYFSWK